MGKPLNSKQRLEGAERIRDVHDAHEGVLERLRDDYAGKKRKPVAFLNLQAHNHRAELLELHADAEREVERLREYAEHKCKYDKKENWDTYDPPKFGCTCGLDELLNQESDNEGKD